MDVVTQTAVATIRIRVLPSRVGVLRLRLAQPGEPAQPAKHQRKQRHDGEQCSPAAGISRSSFGQWSPPSSE